MLFIFLAQFKIGISAFVLGSQFMQKLSDVGYTGVKRWHQKVRLLSIEVIVYIIFNYFLNQG